VAVSIVCLLGGLCEARVPAAEPSGAELSRSPAGRAHPIGDDDPRQAQPELELSLEFASAYVFRGYNVFQAENQREQKWVERPRIVWTVSGTGLSMGYASANQLTGDNLVHNVAAGLGVEQDLFVGYSFGRGAELGLLTELAAVAYPAASSTVAGTGMPWFVSVSAEPHYRHSAYLYAGYLRGVQRGPLGESQFYLNPRVEKRFTFGRRFELELEVGGGVKIRQVDLSVTDNMFDVLTAASLYFAISEVFYVGARVGWAWTNFTPFRDPDTGQSVTPGFADEYVPFLALSVGAEFAPGWSAGRPSRHRGAHAM
jgi:hypothetical protein